MIAVEHLTVAFGGVRPLDDVTVSFEAEVCGLIGPNGAGKTTFFNVLSGFVTPRAGVVRAGGGKDLLALSARQRARWGLRRTFQQEQIVDRLTVGENLAVAQEHCGGRDGHTAAEVLDAVGLTVAPAAPAAHLSARDRRLLEIARALVGAPRLVLLDEPGAGLDDEETTHLAGLIRRLPERFGVQVLLVDHDMSLVEATCQTLAVLDFGRLIASGACGAVLADDTVKRAYLGVEEEEVPACPSA